MIATVGVPFDEFSSFLRGSEKAPPLIRQAFHSDSSNYFSENGINLLNHPELVDLGDLELPRGKEAISAIESKIDHILRTANKILSLGGDHSISYPIVKAISRKYESLTILHIDAHPDLYDSFEGNTLSHACPFARIMEQGLCNRLVQVGIRTMNFHQREQANRFGVEVIEMKNWHATLNLKLEGPIYISLDIDAIDPAFAPGVSHHEPGGFTSREVISLLQNTHGNVVGADLVEYNASRDVGGITAMLAAKLYKEMLDLLLRV
jgi:agmatinase